MSFQSRLVIGPSIIFLIQDVRQFNLIYVAARRKRVQTLRFKVSDSKFAVVVEGVYDRKIEFIRAGNTYYTRKAELPGLFNAAQKLGVRLVHRPIKERTNEGIFRVAIARSKLPRKKKVVSPGLIFSENMVRK